LKKTELVELVDRVYATWNQVVPHSSSKVIYEAWWRLLSDLEAEDCHLSLDSLAIDDSYMPRPGALRKHVVLAQVRNTKEHLPSSAQEAWATVQKMGAAAARGEYIHTPIHSCLQKSLALLGGTSALALHTNGDRNSFIEVYNQVVTLWENELSHLTSNKLTGTKQPEENDR
jgi:hypothetical protein